MNTRKNCKRRLKLRLMIRSVIMRNVLDFQVARPTSSLLVSEVYFASQVFRSMCSNSVILRTLITYNSGMYN